MRADPGAIVAQPQALVLDDENGQRSIALSKLGFVTQSLNGHLRGGQQGFMSGVSEFIRTIADNAGARVVDIYAVSDSSPETRGCRLLCSTFAIGQQI